MEIKIVRRSLPTSGTFLSKLMTARGIIGPDSGISEMLHHSGLKNADKAAKILADAISEKKRILIAGDYDVDGATGVTIAVRGLRMMGGDPDFIVPDRMKHGYGLSSALVDVIARRGVDLIVTVDNGISSIDGVARATELGIPVLVTDHHLPGEKLPSALCIVNPNQPDCTFASKHLSGAGVMFYVMMALRAELTHRGVFSQQAGANNPPPKLGGLLDLVALSTIADVVHLDHNNRVLARAGIGQIRAGKAIPMIMALLAVAKRDPARATSADLGFAVGPRLNAAGRLEDMTVGIKGLLTDDIEEATRIATELDGINKHRKEIEESMKGDAAAMMDDIEKIMSTDGVKRHSVVLYHEKWHAGVIGILASRVKDAHNLPSIMFATGENGTLKGSARSIPALHIRDAINVVFKRHPDIIITFGGHAMAAGLTIKAEYFSAFSAAFDLAVAEMTERVDTAKVFETDGVMPLLSVNDILSVEAEPWGSGYMPPEFDGVFEILSQRLIGDGKHLKLKLKAAEGPVIKPIYEAIMFFQEELLPGTIHALYTPSVNEYKGSSSVQLMVKQVFGNMSPALAQSISDVQASTGSVSEKPIPSSL